MWSPVGQQIMIPTPKQPKKCYGIGAVDYHSGQTVVRIEKHKRREQIAALLEDLLQMHPGKTVYIAWDNVSTHSQGIIEEVLRAAAGRLVLMYLPTYSPWLNPIEMLWRHFRRVVTHCELFDSVKSLVEATHSFFINCNNQPEKVISVIGAHPTEFS